MAACVQALLGTFILVAAIAKLEDRDAFSRTLAAIPWVRPWLARYLSVGVPIGEVATFGLLVSAPRVGAVAALALLALFTAVIMIELVSGRRFACGCFGSVATNTVGPATVTRNVALCGLAVMLLMLPYSSELAAALTGVGLAFMVLIIELAGSTITREHLL